MKLRQFLRMPIILQLGVFQLVKSGDRIRTNAFKNESLWISALRCHQCKQRECYQTKDIPCYSQSYFSH